MASLAAGMCIGSGCGGGSRVKAPTPARVGIRATAHASAPHQVRLFARMHPSGVRVPGTRVLEGTLVGSFRARLEIILHPAESFGGLMAPTFRFSTSAGTIAGEGHLRHFSLGATNVATYRVAIGRDTGRFVHVSGGSLIVTTKSHGAPWGDDAHTTVSVTGTA